MAEEWGPWVEHDGRGVPVPIGTVVNTVWEDGHTMVATAGESLTPEIPGGGWNWENRSWCLVIVRYRTRQYPRAMETIRGLLQPVKEDA